jgi:hypothetical protein
MPLALRALGRFPALKFTFVLSAGTNPRPRRSGVGALGYHGEDMAIGREYFVRQAAILFRFAKATRDPTISAALMEKAADLKLQVDEPGAQSDLSPRAPDVEPPPTT